jgi:hypothetical protein
MYRNHCFYFISLQKIFNSCRDPVHLSVMRSLSRYVSVVPTYYVCTVRFSLAYCQKILKYRVGRGGVPAEFLLVMPVGCVCVGEGGGTHSIPAVSCVPAAPIYGLRLAVVTPLLLLHLGKLLHDHKK